MAISIASMLSTAKLSSSSASTSSTSTNQDASSTDFADFLLGQFDLLNTAEDPLANSIAPPQELLSSEKASITKDEETTEEVPIETSFLTLAAYSPPNSATIDNAASARSSTFDGQTQGDNLSPISIANTSGDNAELTPQLLKASISPDSNTLPASFAVEADPSQALSLSLSPTTTAQQTISTQDAALETQKQITSNLTSDDWPTQFSEKVAWLASDKQQYAEIHINPPQLGPIHITLNMAGDQVSATFASPHHEVRQAIESAMPQLKEMLATTGIDLGQTDVGSQLPQQSFNQTFQNPSSSAQSSAEPVILSGDDESDGQSALPIAIKRGQGLVDLFA